MFFGYYSNILLKAAIICQNCILNLLFLYFVVENYAFSGGQEEHFEWLTISVVQLVVEIYEYGYIDGILKVYRFDLISTVHRSKPTTQISNRKGRNFRDGIKL